MPTILQLRRGTTAQNDNYAGSVGEITVDSTLNTLRVHDGSTTGGHSLVGNTATQTLTNKTLTSPTLNSGVVGTALTLNAQAELRYADSDSSNYVAFKSPATVASDVTWTLPNADADVSGYALVSDSAGTLSWAPAGATISQDESTNSGLQLYFASTTSGALTAVNYDSGLTYNPSSGTLTTAAVSATDLTGTLQTASQTNINGVGTITTGTWSATDIAVLHGGTGASDAGTARTNLGLAIGTDVQAYNATLAAVAGGTYSGDDSITTVGTIGTGVWAATDVAIAHGGTGASDAATALTNLGAYPASNPSGYVSSSGVTSVSGTAPVVSSGGATPAISMAAATASVNGYMTSTYASKLDGIAAGATNVTNNNQLTNGAGYVTSSGVTSIAAGSYLTGGTVTSTGTFAVDATSANTANKVVARDGSGNFSAGVVTATATAARYADLAEKYTSDLEYSPGTVVVFGGPYEVTESTKSHDSAVAGVVSTDPAYLMNSDLKEGVAVALTGRVPCIVKGPVKKGTVLVTSDVPGAAQAIDPAKFSPGVVIGKALEDLDTSELTLIEIAIGRF
jgi:hypothetical protein